MASGCGHLVGDAILSGIILSGGFGPAMKTSESSKEWVAIKTPEELRAIYSNTTLRGTVFGNKGARSTPFMGHYRSDGTGVLIVGDRRLPRTWEIKGNDQVCVTDAEATNCYRYQRDKDNRNEFFGQHVTADMRVRFAIDSGIKPEPDIVQAPAVALASAMPAGRAKAADEGGVPGEGMPAAGSQWVYGFIDRQYGRDRIDVTVRARRVDGFSVDEAVTTSIGSSVPTAERLVDAGVARFRTQRLAEGAELTEFAPYFLAAHGEKAPMVRITADGYPVVSGNPAWITESEMPVWEQVTVPAGTFKALRLEVSGRRARDPFSPIVTKRFLIRVWYAPEVKRYVRLEQEEWLTSTQNSHIVVELLNFGPAS